MDMPSNIKCFIVVKTRLTDAPPVQLHQVGLAYVPACVQTCAVTYSVRPLMHLPGTADSQGMGSRCIIAALQVGLDLFESPCLSVEPLVCSLFINSVATVLLQGTHQIESPENP